VPVIDVSLPYTWLQQTHIDQGFPAAAGGLGAGRGPVPGGGCWPTRARCGGGGMADPGPAWLPGTWRGPGPG